MKILNQYFDEIFDMIFALKPNFPGAPYPKQKEFLDDQVTLWIEREKEIRQALVPEFVESTSEENEEDEGEQGQGEGN